MHLFPAMAWRNIAAKIARANAGQTLAVFLLGAHAMDTRVVFSWPSVQQSCLLRQPRRIPHGWACRTLSSFHAAFARSRTFLSGLSMLGSCRIFSSSSRLGLTRSAVSYRDHSVCPHANLWDLVPRQFTVLGRYKRHCLALSSATARGSRAYPPRDRQTRWQTNARINLAVVRTRASDISLRHSSEGRP